MKKKKNYIPVIISSLSISFFLFLFFFTPLPIWAEVVFEGIIINADYQKDLLTIRTAGDSNNPHKEKGMTVLVSGFMKADIKDEETGTAVSPHTLTAGDRVKITSDDNGIPKTIRVTSEYMSGEILFVSKEKLILSGGEQIYFDPAVIPTLNGMKSDIKDIQRGFRAFLRIDPQTHRAYSLEVINIKNKKMTEGEEPGDISSINISDSASYRKGGTFTANITITSKGTPYLTITGIAYKIPMKKTGDKSYQVSFPIQRGDIRRSYALFTLIGDKGSITRVNPVSFDIATTPPIITPDYPSENQRVKGDLTSIFVRISSIGSLIKADSCGLWIDGKPVTAGLERNVAFLLLDLTSDQTSTTNKSTGDKITSSSLKLNKGKHSIRVEITDEAGNTTRKEWEFYIE